MSKYSQIREMDISNGKGIGVSIFFSGCKFHCKNCFNKELWDKECGHDFSNETIKQIKTLMNKEYITRLSILGGDSLMSYNLNDTLKLIKEIKKEFPYKKIWLWTGYEFEYIVNKYNEYKFTPFAIGADEYLTRMEIISKCDYLIDGRYIDELKDITLPFRGSSNQRIIDVQKSLKLGEIVEYMD